MILNRRSLIRGLFVAPAIIRTPGLLMPIKPLVEPLNYPVEFMNVQPLTEAALTELIECIRREMAIMSGVPMKYLWAEDVHIADAT